MTYSVKYTRTADKQLEKIARSDRRLARAILDKIDKLADDPRPDGCRELTGYPGLWRIKVRQVMRVVYRIDDDGTAVIVALIEHRSSVYETLRRVAAGI